MWSHINQEEVVQRIHQLRVDNLRLKEAISQHQLLIEQEQAQREHYESQARRLEEEEKGKRQHTASLIKRDHFKWQLTKRETAPPRILQQQTKTVGMRQRKSDISGLTAVMPAQKTPRQHLPKEQLCTLRDLDKITISTSRKTLETQSTLSVVEDTRPMRRSTYFEKVVQTNKD